MVLAMMASVIIMLAVAILATRGQKSWADTYERNNSDFQVETIAATTALGAFGRRANKTDYRLYARVDDNFYRAVPDSEPDEVVIGNALELRYWDTELSDEIMTITKTATAYVLFYLDDGDFKTDYGPYPPGAIDAAGNRITGDDVTTLTLIRNVTNVEFSHTAQNMAGDGKGCIRMKLTAQDTSSGESKVILAATLMRNIWP